MLCCNMATVLATSSLDFLHLKHHILCFLSCRICLVNAPIWMPIQMKTQPKQKSKKPSMSQETANPPTKTTLTTRLQRNDSVQNEDPKCKKVNPQHAANCLSLPVRGLGSLQVTNVPPTVPSGKRKEFANVRSQS